MLSNRRALEQARENLEKQLTAQKTKNRKLRTDNEELTKELTMERQRRVRADKQLDDMSLASEIEKNGALASQEKIYLDQLAKQKRDMENDFIRRKEAHTRRQNEEEGMREKQRKSELSEYEKVLERRLTDEMSMKYEGIIKKNAKKISTQESDIRVLRADLDVAHSKLQSTSDQFHSTQRKMESVMQESRSLALRVRDYDAVKTALHRHRVLLRNFTTQSYVRDFQLRKNVAVMHDMLIDVIKALWDVTTLSEAEFDKKFPLNGRVRAAIDLHGSKNWKRLLLDRDHAAGNDPFPLPHHETQKGDAAADTAMASKNPVPAYADGRDDEGGVRPAPLDVDDTGADVVLPGARNMRLDISSSSHMADPYDYFIEESEQDRQRRLVKLRRQENAFTDGIEDGGSRRDSRRGSSRATPLATAGNSMGDELFLRIADPKKAAAVMPASPVASMTARQQKLQKLQQLQGKSPNKQRSLLDDSGSPRQRQFWNLDFSVEHRIRRKQAILDDFDEGSSRVAARNILQQGGDAVLREFDAISEGGKNPDSEPQNALSSNTRSRTEEELARQVRTDAFLKGQADEQRQLGRELLAYANQIRERQVAANQIELQPWLQKSAKFVMRGRQVNGLSLLDHVSEGMKAVSMGVELLLRQRQVQRHTLSTFFTRNTELTEICLASEQGLIDRKESSLQLKEQINELSEALKTVTYKHDVLLGKLISLKERGLVAGSGGNPASTIIAQAARDEMQSSRFNLLVDQNERRMRRNKTQAELAVSPAKVGASKSSSMVELRYVDDDRSRPAQKADILNIMSDLHQYEEDALLDDNIDATADGMQDRIEAESLNSIIAADKGNVSSPPAGHTRKVSEHRERVSDELRPLDDRYTSLQEAYADKAPPRSFAKSTGASRARLLEQSPSPNGKLANPSQPLGAVVRTPHDQRRSPRSASKRSPYASLGAVKARSNLPGVVRQGHPGDSMRKQQPQQRTLTHTYSSAALLKSKQAERRKAQLLHAQGGMKEGSPGFVGSDATRRSRAKKSQLCPVMGQQGFEPVTKHHNFAESATSFADGQSGPRRARRKQVAGNHGQPPVALHGSPPQQRGGGRGSSLSSLSAAGRRQGGLSRSPSRSPRRRAGRGREVSVVNGYAYYDSVRKHSRNKRERRQSPIAVKFTDN